MRGQPLDQCRKGHSPVWYRRDQGCPLCGLATQIGERHQVINQLRRRIAELEMQLSGPRPPDDPRGGN